MTNPVCFFIDDDEDDREIFTWALEKADATYSCITAKSGAEALALLNADISFVPNFIFIDLNMPLMDGKECLQNIKSMERFANIPIIIYTTSSYSKDAEETRLLGASHFLVKPPGMTILTKVLTRIINREALPYYIESLE